MRCFTVARVSSVRGAVARAGYTRRTADVGVKLARGPGRRRRSFPYRALQTASHILSAASPFLSSLRCCFPFPLALTPGLAVWLLGFGIEVAADAQKAAWRAVPSNRGRFIDTGLWSLSRHPNYFGEMTLWWGAAIIAAGGLASGGAVAAACASPLFVTLLLRRVSGVPMLARAAEKRWGKEPAFQAYKRRTRELLPLPRFGRGAREG